MLAGSDRRVRAAVPIYGCGYNYDRRNVRWGYPEPSDDLALFQRILSAEAHAPYVTCPVLFLSATNDFHGLMDRAFESLRAVPAPTWQAFTPRYNHHLEHDEGNDLAALDGVAAQTREALARLARSLGLPGRGWSRPRGGLAGLEGPGRHGRCVLHPGRDASSGAVLAASRGRARPGDRSGPPARSGYLGRPPRLCQRDPRVRNSPQLEAGPCHSRPARQGPGHPLMAPGPRAGQGWPGPLVLHPGLYRPEPRLVVPPGRPRRHGRHVRHVERREAGRSDRHPARHPPDRRPAVPGQGLDGLDLPLPWRLHGRRAQGFADRG